MSVNDKVVAAVTPPESADTRLKARAKARVAAGKGDWLAMVLNHHERIEEAFAAVKSAIHPAARISSLQTLSTLLTGHSIAEEAALYPALAKSTRIVTLSKPIRSNRQPSCNWASSRTYHP